MIHILFLKKLCSKIFYKKMTQKAESYVILWKSQEKSFAGCDSSYSMIYLTWLEYFASVFPGIYFYHSFYSIVWNSDQFKGKGFLFQVYHCMSLLSKHIIFWKIWMSNLFHFVDLDGTILNLIRKFANKTKACNWCFQFFF